MNEMNEPKKISYRSLTEKMSDEALKNIVAGCGGSGSGPYNISCKKNGNLMTNLCEDSCSCSNCPSDHDQCSCSSGCVD